MVGYGVQKPCQPPNPGVVSRTGTKSAKVSSCFKTCADVYHLMSLPGHSIVHFLLLFFGGGSSAATIASSKTSLSLYWVNALHSTYLTAPRSLAMRSPSSLRTGCIFCFASLSRTDGSSRRSVCVPTIRQGTPGQWWWTSGNHFSRTFSNEAGEVTEKHTRNTSVCG